MTIWRSSGSSTFVAGYDHNWDLEEYPSQLIDEAGDFIDYIAFHCYAGDVSNQSLYHEQYRLSDPHY